MTLVLYVLLKATHSLDPFKHSPDQAEGLSCLFRSPQPLVVALWKLALGRNGVGAYTCVRARVHVCVPAHARVHTCLLALCEDAGRRFWRSCVHTPPFALVVVSFSRHTLPLLSCHQRNLRAAPCVSFRTPLFLAQDNCAAATAKGYQGH